MTEKIESFSSRKLAESNGTVMTTQNILREARMLKNVIKDPKQQQSDVKEEDDLKEEKEEREMEEKEEQHRSFSRTGNDLIETDDELVEVSEHLPHHANPHLHLFHHCHRYNYVLSSSKCL